MISSFCISRARFITSRYAHNLIILKISALLGKTFYVKVGRTGTDRCAGWRLDVMVLLRTMLHCGVMEPWGRRERAGEEEEEGG